MIVGGVSGSIGHRTSGCAIRNASATSRPDRASASPAFGDQKIDFLAVLERFERAGGRRLQHDHPSCRRSVTMFSRIIQSSSTTRTVTISEQLAGARSVAEASERDETRQGRYRSRLSVEIVQSPILGQFDGEIAHGSEPVCLILGEMGFEPLKPVGEPDAANSRIRFDVRLGGSFAAIVRCTVSEVAKLSRLRVRPGTGSAPGRASRYCGRGRRGPTRWRPSRRRARETDGSRAPA